MKKYIEVRINIARAKLTDPASEIKKIYISAKKSNRRILGHHQRI